MINQIKARLSILDAVQRYAKVDLKAKGNSYWCKCLTNYERTPSMQILPDKDRYRCFSCGRNGDTIDLVAEALNLNITDTIKYLIKDLGLSETISDKQIEIDAERLKREQERQVKAEQLNTIDKEYNRLIDIQKLMYSFLMEIKDESDLERFEIIQSLKNKDLLEYWIDVLLNGSLEEKLEIVEITKAWSPWKIGGKT
jgi:hypothetical protein